MKYYESFFVWHSVVIISEVRYLSREKMGIKILALLVGQSLDLQKVFQGTGNLSESGRKCRIKDFSVKTVMFVFHTQLTNI